MPVLADGPTTRVEPEIVVVHLSGSITSELENRIVEPLINDLLNQNEKKLIFDLTGVEKIDSTGVNIIIQCVLAVRKAGAGPSMGRFTIALIALDAVFSPQNARMVHR